MNRAEMAVFAKRARHPPVTTSHREPTLVRHDMGHGVRGDRARGVHPAVGVGAVWRGAWGAITAAVAPPGRGWRARAEVIRMISYASGTARSVQTNRRRSHPRITKRSQKAVFPFRLNGLRPPWWRGRGPRCGAAPLTYGTRNFRCF